MTSRTRLTLILLTVLSAALFAAASPDGVDSSPDMMRGAPDLKSAGQMVFGPGDVLFVGDSLGAAVYAIDLGDDDELVQPEERLRIADLDEKIAALLGTTARDVLVNDLAVHPRSKNTYLSVSRGRGDDAVPALVKVTPRGEIREVPLADVRYSKAAISNAPGADDKTRRGQPKRLMTITDLAYAAGRLYVAGLSNEEFASNLRTIPYPFTDAMSATSVEIFHGAHGRYETHAPIRTLVPYEVKGKPHLLAAYTCTPLVTIPVEQLEDGGHLKGTTVAELGFGNTPLDMVTVEQDGETYLLVVNSSRAGMKIRPADIDKAAAITTEVDRKAVTAGVPFVNVPLGGVLRLAVLDDDNAVALRRDVRTGALELRVMSTGWL